MSVPRKLRYPDDYNHGVHICGSCEHSHYAPYERWCRAERMHLFPGHFREWTEEEHRAMKHPLTWEQQQTIWHHRRTWEAMYDGQLSQAQAEAVIARSEPLPPPALVAGMIRTLAGSMIRRTPRFVQDVEAEERRTEGRSEREREQLAMALVQPVSVPPLDPAEVEVPA